VLETAKVDSPPAIMFDKNLVDQICVFSSEGLFLEKAKNMGLIIWLLTGLAAGAVAKQLTPQDEKAGWVTSLIIGLIGAMLGGFVFRIVGIQATSLLGGFLSAVIGSVLFLFIYHRYLSDKFDIGI